MILIIDFGSQVTQLIARRIREINVYCEIKNYNISVQEIKKINPDAIILSGGPASVCKDNFPSIDKKIFDFNIPILGICYGQQLICKLLGGEVNFSNNREFGKASIIPTDTTSPLLNSFSNFQVWMSHSDVVTKIPNGFSVTAKTEHAPYAVIEDRTRKIYGIQFHPEVVHTIDGKLLIENFVLNISMSKPNWTMDNFIQDSLNNIKKEVGDKRVICGLSGGVDSSVVAFLLHKAIGKNLTCIFVDHGLLRKNETEEVQEIFKENAKINLIYVNAKEIFLKKLENVIDPEKKRKIIGKAFIQIFDEEANKIKNVEFLAQGTLYPDVIESLHPTGGISHTIKTHHNVGGLPKNMKLKLIEPLKFLFKDEVRKLGKALDMDNSIIYRHPFPGPGLAIRIIGNITKNKVDILQKSDSIFIEEIKKAGLYKDIWQAFCVLTPIKTVGVMGDIRTYEYVLSLRAVTSVDGMTAEIFKFDYEVLQKITSRIIGEVKGINRVVYDITSKPPGTIEWE